MMQTNKETKPCNIQAKIGKHKLSWKLPQSMFRKLQAITTWYQHRCVLTCVLLTLLVAGRSVSSTYDQACDQCEPKQLDLCQKPPMPLQPPPKTPNSKDGSSEQGCIFFFSFLLCCCVNLMFYFSFNSPSTASRTSPSVSYMSNQGITLFTFRLCIYTLKNNTRKRTHAYAHRPSLFHSLQTCSRDHYRALSICTVQVSKINIMTLLKSFKQLKPCWHLQVSSCGNFSRAQWKVP